MKQSKVRKGVSLIVFVLLACFYTPGTVFGQVVVGGSFSGPAGIAAGASGNIYATSQDGNAVVIIKPAGTITIFGQTGFGAGDFASGGPASIALDAAENIYVADRGANRVQVFDQEGNFLSAKTGLNFPYGVAIDAEGRIGVAEETTNNFKVFDKNFNLLFTVGSSGSAQGQFNSPQGVDFDQLGNIFVADQGNHRVQVFDKDGAFVRMFGTQGSGDNEFINPSKIRIYNNEVYVSDANLDIKVFNLSGVFQRRLSLNSPSGSDGGGASIAFTATGNIAAASAGKDRISVYQPNGTFVKAYGGTGSATGELNFPRGVAKLSTGDFAVVDQGNRRVQIFSASGDFKSKFGSAGTGNSQFSGSINDVDADQNDNIYVLDAGNKRVQVFSSAGVFQRVISTGTLTPNKMALDGSGNVWLTFPASSLVKEFDGTTGQELLSFGSAGSATGQFRSGMPDIDIDKNSGHVYVVDATTCCDGRVQIFNSAGVFQSAPSIPTGIGQVSVAGSTLYVAGQNDYMIKAYNINTSALLLSSGGKGLSVSRNNGVNDFEFDPVSQKVYLSDYNNNRIQVLTYAPEIHVAQAGNAIAVNGTFDMGAVPVAESKQLQITVFSQGLSNISLSGNPKVQISGTNAAEFVIDQSNLASSIIGASSFKVTFTPGATGERTATIAIQNNDPDEGTYTFTIKGTGKLDQAVTFQPLASKKYADPSFPLTATADSGLPVTFQSSNAAVATISNNTVTITGVGTTTIKAIQAGNDLYVAASESHNLTVTKSALVVKADNKSKTYTDLNPDFTVSYTGFKGNEGPSMLDVLPTTATDAMQQSDAGEYDITIAGTGSDNNYTIEASAVKGKLVIQKAPLTVTAVNKDRIYGAANPAFTITYEGFRNGETSAVIDTAPVAVTAATSASDAGDYDIVPSGGADNNYAFTYVKGKLAIGKASQVITFPPVSARVLGDAAFNLTATSSSSLPVTYSTVSDKVSLNGAQVTLVKAGRVTLSATQQGSKNYTAAAATEVSFCINPARPVITASFTDPSAPVLTSGNSAGNQWYRNNTMLSGATNVTLTASQAGTYKVQTKADDCVSEFSVDYAVIVTGLERSSGEPVSLYPNPTVDFVRINGVNRKTTHMVCDVTGVRQLLPSSFEEDRLVIDARGLAVGVYIVRLSGNDGVHQVRFVKK